MHEIRFPVSVRLSFLFFRLFVCVCLRWSSARIVWCVWWMVDDRDGTAFARRGARAAPGVGASSDGSRRRDRGAARPGGGGRARAEDRRERTARGVRPRVRTVHVGVVLLGAEAQAGERHPGDARKRRRRRRRPRAFR